MRKALKVVGVINIIASVFLLVLLLSFLSQNSQGSDDWALIFLRLISVFFLLISVVLTIPMIIFLVKYKLQSIKFYFYTHISLFVLSALLLVLTYIAE